MLGGYTGCIVHIDLSKDKRYMIPYEVDGKGIYSPAITHGSPLHVWMV